MVDRQPPKFPIIKPELEFLYARLFGFMKDISPYFLPGWMIDAIYDYQIQFRILTEYFSPKGVHNNPYIYINLNNIRLTRNAVVHNKPLTMKMLIDGYENILVFAKISDVIFHCPRSIRNQLEDLALRWKQILYEKCCANFGNKIIPDFAPIKDVKCDFISPIVGSSIVKYEDDINIGKVDKIDKSAFIRKTDFVMPPKTDNIIEDILVNLRITHQKEIKNKRILFLDGKYKDKEGSFCGWNGTNCLIYVSDIGKICVSKTRRVRVYL